MPTPVITVQNLSKSYTIGERASYGSLREEIMQTITAPFRRRRSQSRSAENNTVWALKDISFEVEKGDVVGIIGRNGAGKSTLLKILSRITEPTSGRINLLDRVASLLEVGTGFHPELTGRENIFLNGALLGMKNTEIISKFDEIVAFSEIERFLDTPVKRYSSGMYVRLAFAVAAHLAPDILIVDEVLAVGDFGFQQKCLNHLRKLTMSGMTILLVSHNMAAIQSCCNRAILLQNGRLAKTGGPIEVIDFYHQTLRTRDQNDGRDGNIPSGDQPVEITSFEMYGEDGASRRELKFGESIKIRIELYANIRIEHPLINFGIRRGDGVIICNFNNWYDNFKVDYIEGKCSLEGWLPPLRLVPDYYEIHVLVWPWGGGHLTGDVTRSAPYVARTFGDFSIKGPSLNFHDGVFQIPATKWRFTRGAYSMEFTDITPTNIEEAFKE